LAIASVYPFRSTGVVVADSIGGLCGKSRRRAPALDGQGVLAMVGVSLGAITSHLGSGYLLEHAGPRAPYLVGGIGGLVLAASVPWWLPPVARPAPAADEQSPQR
jgi:MFS family permease